MYYPLWTDDTVVAHAVTIVGWDDHYDRALFGENTPPGLIILSLAAIAVGQAKDRRFKFIERVCP